MKEVIPLTNERREIILYDKYVDGRWVGSRRTLDQALNDIGLDATVKPARTVKP